MAAQTPPAAEKAVVLLRPGLDAQVYVLPEGSTLGDLLREARASTQPQDILIDGLPLTDLLVLRPGMVVSLAIGDGGVGGGEPWRDTVGMFRDDSAFEEMVNSERASREEA